MNKHYLSNGIYAQLEDKRLLLTIETRNKVENRVTNKIYLEPLIISHLLEYIIRNFKVEIK